MLKRTLMVLGLLVALAGHAQASLLGVQVNGSLTFGGGGTNFFNPAAGAVPPGYGNSGGQPVTIADPLVEFGAVTVFADGYFVDFTATQMTFTFTSGIAGGFGGLTIVLTALTAGAFEELTLVSSTVPGLAASLTGDAITLSIDSTTTAVTTYSATYTLVTPETQVPAPPALALFAVALAGLVAARRRA